MPRSLVTNRDRFFFFPLMSSTIPRVIDDSWRPLRVTRSSSFFLSFFLLQNLLFIDLLIPAPLWLTSMYKNHIFYWKFLRRLRHEFSSRRFLFCEYLLFAPNRASTFKSYYQWVCMPMRYGMVCSFLRWSWLKQNLQCYQGRRL